VGLTRPARPEVKVEPKKTGRRRKENQGKSKMGRGAAGAACDYGLN
jgi:hypothetical protein